MRRDKIFLKALAIVFSSLIISVCWAKQSSATTNTNANTNTNTSQSTTAGQYLSDTAITAKVKSSLLADKDISSLRISVTTKNGKVTLSGKVKDPVQKQKAVQIAKNVSGVKQVKDKLQIKQ